MRRGGACRPTGAVQMHLLSTKGFLFSCYVCKFRRESWGQNRGGVLGEKAVAQEPRDEDQVETRGQYTKGTGVHSIPEVGSLV